MIHLFSIKKQLVCCLILFIGFCSVSPGLASESALRAFLKNVATLEARFSQRVEDESGSVLESSSGRFYLSRPGKFRWDYKNTEFEGELGQQIVADGESLFFYDPDLDQASQRSLSNAVAQTPSLLLVMSNADLDQHFKTIDLGKSDALSWVALQPSSEDAGYLQLIIGFLGDKLDTLVLEDGIGNTTRLELNDIAVNQKIDQRLFQFEVPEGADLLSE